jgi:hypothetical protein
MSRPNRLNSSSRSRARTFAANVAHRVRLTEGTQVVSHHSGFDVADWRFLAEASVALDVAASVDELQSVVLRLVVPKVADFCVLRIHAGLASALGATACAAHARSELLPFLRRSTPGTDELLSRRHPANRVQVTGVPDWGDVDEHRLELMASDSEHLKPTRHGPYFRDGRSGGEAWPSVGEPHVGGDQAFGPALRSGRRRPRE